MNQEVPSSNLPFDRKSPDGQRHPLLASLKRGEKTRVASFKILNTERLPGGRGERRKSLMQAHQHFTDLKEKCI